MTRMPKFGAVLAGTGLALFSACVSADEPPIVDEPGPEPDGAANVIDAAVRGWQLTPTNVGLAPHDLVCSRLPLYMGSSRPGTGAVITGVRIEKHLDLTLGNITIEKSCIVPKSTGVLGSLVSTTVCPKDCNLGMPAGAKATIRDSEISGQNLPASQIASSCAFDGVADLARNYIHDIGSGICFRETGLELSPVVEQNYVHRLRHAGEAHHDAATIRDFRKNAANTRTVTFRNNRFDSTTNVDAASHPFQTGALFIQPTWAGFGIHNVVVEGNLLEGGGINLALEQSKGGNSNTRAVDNRFRSTEHGEAHVSGSPGWSQWSGNHRFDPARPDGAGLPIARPTPTP